MLPRDQTLNNHFIRNYYPQFTEENFLNDFFRPEKNNLHLVALPPKEITEYGDRNARDLYI